MTANRLWLVSSFRDLNFFIDWYASAAADFKKFSVAPLAGRSLREKLIFYTFLLLLFPGSQKLFPHKFINSKPNGAIFSSFILTCVLFSGVRWEEEPRNETTTKNANTEPNQTRFTIFPSKSKAVSHRVPRKSPTEEAKRFWRLDKCKSLHFRRNRLAIG